MATATEKAHSTAEHVAQAAHEAIDRAAQTGGRVEERVRETGERARARAHNIEESAASYFREHPYISVGAAVAAGMLLGALLRR